MPQIPLLVAAVAVEVGIPMWLSIAAVNTALAIGVSYGAQLLSRALARSGGDPSLGNLSAVNSPEVRGSIKQDIPPHRIWIGEMKGGGAFFFYEKKPPYLYVGLIHSVLPITSVEKVFIAQQEITFRSLPDGEIISPLPIAGLPAYNTRLEVCFQFGSSLDQPVNPLIARDFPEKGADFRQPGCAVSVWKYDFGADFDEFQLLWGQTQVPDAQIVARGCPLPDPREPTHELDFDPRDIESLYAAMATWSYDNNASKVEAFHAAMPFGLNAGPAAVYQGRYAELLKESIAFDDENIPLKDSDETQKRHTIDGIITLEERPMDTMEAMLPSNGGFISARAGGVRIQSSQPMLPIRTIRDSDITGGFKYRDASPKRSLVNTPRARFISPENDYQDAETQWPSEADIAALVEADGEPLEQTLKLNFVRTHQRAQRRLKAFALESRLGKAVEVVTKLRLLGVTEGDCVRLDLTHYTPPNDTYSAESWNITEDFNGIAFSLAQSDPTIPRNWVPDTDEQPFIPEEA